MSEITVQREIELEHDPWTLEVDIVVEYSVEWFPADPSVGYMSAYCEVEVDDFYCTHESDDICAAVKHKFSHDDFHDEAIQYVYDNPQYEE